MDIDWFHYELWYISFPIDPINLKFIGYVHTVVVNISTKFEVIWTKLDFMSNLEFLANLSLLKFCGPEMVKIYSTNYFGLGIYTFYVGK